jgi:hypothetical protein
LARLRAAWTRRDPVKRRRGRFLASCAVMASAGFALATLFDTAPVLRVPACWNIMS